MDPATIRYIVASPNPDGDPSLKVVMFFTITATGAVVSGENNATLGDDWLDIFGFCATDAGVDIGL